MLSFTKSRTERRIKNLYWPFLLLFLAAEIYPQWVQTNGPKWVTAFVVSDTNIFASSTSGGVFLSTDSGTNWNEVNSGLRDWFVTDLIINDKNLFAGTFGSGVFMSTNNGFNWLEVNNGLMDKPITILSLAQYGTSVFAGLGGACGVFLTTDEGSTWCERNSGLPAMSAKAIAVSDTNLIVSGYSFSDGTYTNYVYLSSDNGLNWTPVNLGLSQNVFVWSFAVSGPALFAGTGEGVFRSMDDGLTWVSSGLSDKGIIALAGTSDGASLFAGTDEKGVFLSNNNGISWVDVSLGLPEISSLTCFGISVNGSYIFSGVNYHYPGSGEGFSGVWKRPLSEMITDVEKKATKLPKEFALFQNYPNPFNPSTKIQYAISSRQLVTLKIYDLLGREIATLVNEEKPIGTYEVTWNAANLPSGVYFYQLKAGSYTATKKLLLLK